MAEAAQQRFDLENNVRPIDDAAIYAFDEAEQDKIYNAKPWKEDVNFFKKVRVSAVALIKMVMHTRQTGKGVLGEMNEVMGLMKGKVTEDGTFIVMDAFPLPVEGTETRVSAGASANEFMVTFSEATERVGKPENICGWYHSHPGYGCWLSGIDVSTQMAYQAHQEPFLAIVIDPIRTCAAGKVDIGAFRTYPEGYTPPDEKPSEYQSIPLDKIEDFGVHAKQYYQLPIETFKNSLDNALLQKLWNKYWIDTLSSSPLLHNRSFANKMIQDCAQKLEQIDASALSQSRLARMVVHEPKKPKDDNPLRKIAIDASLLAGEQVQGLTNQVVKFAMFNGRSCRPAASGQSTSEAAAALAAVTPMES
jgi:COP9 signalosome complex subunit 5